MENSTNNYAKFCPNVFVAKCTEQHEKGEVIILTTKYGQEHENEVHNFQANVEKVNFYTQLQDVTDSTHKKERNEKRTD